MWAADVAVEKGAFAPEWESVAQWECPEWFKDAKFGIWAHWGPQCQAESGDWYARGMYDPNGWQNGRHKEQFGDPASFGMKDLCNVESRCVESGGTGGTLPKRGCTLFFHPRAASR